ncbi:hypothetical protein ADK84_16615, partial [Streptomyces sp. NRRL WC-3701]
MSMWRAACRVSRGWADWAGASIEAPPNARHSAAAAVAMLFVTRWLGALACGAADAMGASRGL